MVANGGHDGQLQSLLVKALSLGGASDPAAPRAAVCAAIAAAP
ncbi:hypothetical protein [Arthrobacter sp. MMS18-M83]|nr:hypothetical protein [Arthrobacter sp. MMS18-M83]WAH97443.1 hypothetical protein OW521_00595 [Arthrobacter sp. MMS18-M83]